ncbi:MAG TPA: GNAT family protein [Verrucomicrobiae bacterium]|nr:GNAT family protein [Verrucomicrobiae bacterium]
MRHNLHAEDFNLRLRPVEMEDAAFIVWLRNLEHVKGRVGDSAADLASQEAWLENYFAREGDYYFIAETPGGIPLGTHGIYDVKGTSAEKGRQIMRPELFGAGVPVAILATDLAFEELGLSEVRSNCVSTNFPVHSLHRKSGFKQVGVLRAAQMIDGKPVDLIQFLLTPADWLKVREQLVPLARIAGTQILEWEKTQIGQRQPWIKDETAKSN